MKCEDVYGNQVEIDAGTKVFIENSTLYNGIAREDVNKAYLVKSVEQIPLDDATVVNIELYEASPFHKYLINSTDVSVQEDE